MSEQSDILKLVATKAQEAFQQVPVLVLGSGASAAHNIRGMPSLSKYLQDHVKPANDDEGRAWAAVSSSLEKVGLEQALQITPCPPALVSQIVHITQHILAADDLVVLSRVIDGSERLHLADTLRGMARSTARTIGVITTNYDRIAEYSCDLAGLAHWTGFTNGLIRRSYNSSDVKVIRNGQRDQLVHIFKVHGSLC